jgi:hypothetical protein
LFGRVGIPLGGSGIGGEHPVGGVAEVAGMLGPADALPGVHVVLPVLRAGIAVVFDDGVQLAGGGVKADAATSLHPSGAEHAGWFVLQ